MGAFDKIVAAVSPRRACEREAWRQQLEILRGYDAAGYGRLNAGWRVHNESAEVTDRFSRDVVRARARDLERNSDIAQSILHAYKRNVVGKGYTLQAKTGNDELDEKLEKAWRQWCKARNCDVTGEQSFNQMLRMAVDRKKVDGGLLFLYRYTKQGLVPFQLQAIEVDELDVTASKPKYQGNRVVGGIEYNQWRRPVGYWINQYDIEGWSLNDPVYVEAKDVYFYKSKKRPSQLREMSTWPRPLPECGTPTNLLPLFPSRSGSRPAWPYSSSGRSQAAVLAAVVPERRTAEWTMRARNWPPA